MELFPNKAQRFLRILRGSFPILLLVAVCLIFAFSIDRTSETTLRREQTTLTQALTRSAVHTYALTGRYPENLDSLLAASGITYDHETFLVEYVPNGSNLLPMIAVLPRKEAEGGTQ